jgi:hypothetical protein
MAILMWRTKGEYANLKSAMPIMRCRVSFVDSAGTEHAVDVEAETLYGAVGLAIARFHGAPSEMLCTTPQRRFTVEVRQPTTTHTVEYAAFAKWMMNASANRAISPSEPSLLNC